MTTRSPFIGGSLIQAPAAIGGTVDRVHEQGAALRAFPVRHSQLIAHLRSARGRGDWLSTARARPQIGCIGHGWALAELTVAQTPGGHPVRKKLVGQNDL